MTNADEQRKGIESTVLANYTDGVPEFLHEVVRRIFSGEIKERIGRFQTMYDFCVNEVERQKAAGLDAKVHLMHDRLNYGRSYCHGKLVVEREVEAWQDVDGWFKPPRSHYQRGAFGYEMDGGEPWLEDCNNGARIIVSKPKEGDVGHILSVYAHPKYFADAMKVAVMLAGTALSGKS